MLEGNLLNLDDLRLRVESAIDRECLEHTGSLGDTPRLTGLWFSGVFIPFIAPCLTCLSLQSVTVALSQLIVALRSVPSLEAFEFLESELPVDLPCNLTSTYPCRPDPVKLPCLNHIHLDHGDENANIEDGLHSLLDNLCIRPQSMGVMLAFGVPFSLFVISLRTGLKFKPLTFLRLEGYWDMWVLKPRASHLPPIYPSVSDVQIGFIDAELSARRNYGPLLRNLNLQELRCITEIELCVHIVGMWLSGIHPLLYALPNVTACWVSQGKEHVMDYHPNCVELLSYLSSECEGSSNNATSTSSVHIQYPFPRLRILGIEGIKITSDDVLVQLLQTLTLRLDRDYPILHMLSLPNFRRPREGGLNNMSGVAANIEGLTETVHWGRGSDEGSDDDSDGTSGTDNQFEERNGDEDEGCW